MKNFSNLYQVSKTIRFGLTSVESNKKNTSHEFLKDLIIITENKIKESLKNNTENKPEKLFLVEVEDTLRNMSFFITSWEKCYKRTDQITLSKEYYKNLARKACFDWFWIQSTKKGEIKMPTSSAISFASLSSIEVDRKRAILNYWFSNILKSKQAIDNCLVVVKQIQKAIDENKNHKQIDRVSFRKIFLNLIHQIEDILLPLNNGSIRFDNISKLNIDDDYNTILLEFISSEAQIERKNLLQNVYGIKQYFENNGGNVPFARSTMNEYTAGQKPDRYDEEIDKIIKNLGLESIIIHLKNKSTEEIKTHYEYENLNKTEQLKYNKLTIVERIQLVKYKAIPASVRLLLANHFEAKKIIAKEEVISIFEEIGNPQNIGFDYKTLKDKDQFTLDKYPLKQAFDYAWENLARYNQNSKANQFPIEKCKIFLKDKFQVDTFNTNFKTYALLLAFKEKTTAFEKKGDGAAKNKEEIKEEIITILKDNLLPSFIDKYRKKIINWLNLSASEQEKSNEKRIYLLAKQEIGKIRGQQKTKIYKYNDLTKGYQRTAQFFGKNIAELREKLLEKNEINKIKYLSYIVEDKKQDKYLLLCPLNEKRNNVNKIPKVNNGDLLFYEIKSFTSKTLIKLIKNRGAYKDFHGTTSIFDYDSIKQNWAGYKNDAHFIASLKECLIQSKMAIEQNWNEFNWNFDKHFTYEAIEKEIDSKSYLLVKNSTTSEMIYDLVSTKNYLILPIVNQDITAEKPKNNLNQFTKDWNHIFENNQTHRLHPEFTISYRQPTKEYPKEGEKRYSRFQMIVQFMYEYIPQNHEYLSRKEQITLFNNTEEQKESVANFNLGIIEEIKKDDFYVIGIDRGITQLATLCVLDRSGVIQGDFEIYTRKFDEVKKQWQHSLLDRRNILDITNLRVETTVKGEKVLVDLSEIAVKNKEGNYTQENKQAIKLKQLAYIRKLQFKMQHEPERVLDFIFELDSIENIPELLKTSRLISPYKSGKNYEDIDIDAFSQMLQKFNELVEKYNGLEHAKKTFEYRQFTELDASFNLKNGVVSNMIGVVKFIMEKYAFKTFIALEDLTFAFINSMDGINGQYLKSTREDREVDFKDQENNTLAGLGTYHFFEMQLLKKISNIERNGVINHFVPAFRSTVNYEKIVKKRNNIVSYPFGITTFVSPRNTSITCPNCGNVNRLNREKKNNDRIICKTKREGSKGNCGFDTANFNEAILFPKKTGINLHYIISGDANAAYQVALKVLKNIQ